MDLRRDRKRSLGSSGRRQKGKRNERIGGEEKATEHSRSKKVKLLNVIIVMAHGHITIKYSIYNELHLCMFRKRASDLPEVAAKRRQIDAQAKAAKRQSELFQQKEAEAKAAKRESEIY